MSKLLWQIIISLAFSQILCGQNSDASNCHCHHKKKQRDQAAISHAVSEEEHSRATESISAPSRIGAEQQRETNSMTANTGMESRTLQTTTDSAILKAGTDSTTLKTGADSTKLRVGAESTMLRTGAESITLQTGTNTSKLEVGTEATQLKVGTSSSLLRAKIQQESIPLNIIILMDSSQTMKETLHGTLTGEEENKLTAARRLLRETLNIIPEDVNVGFRVFGNNFRNNNEFDCKQTVLLVPLGLNNRKEIMEEAEQLRPLGMTPLAYALKQTADDFRGMPGLRHVILISDGFETCGGDPCAYIRRLSRLGIKMKIDIVGLGLKRDKIAREHLNCITEASGGEYYDHDLDTVARLAESIKDSIKKAQGEGEVTGRVLTKIKAPQANKLLPMVQNGPLHLLQTNL